MALSAIGGSVSKIIVLLINFFIGLCIGITSYASKAFGKSDYKDLKNIIFNGIFICFIFGAMLSIIGIVFSNNILNAMNTPKETLHLSNIYLRTYLVGIVFSIVYNALTGIIRALGDSKSPLYVLIISSILNIILDLVFVLLFNMGVLGIALATVLSQFVSVFILLFILKSKIPKSSISNHSEKIKISFFTMKNIFALGLPVGFQSIMYSISNIFVQTAVNSFGFLTVAAWASYIRIDGIVDMFISSLSATVITFVGQNLGAGNIGRVKKSVSSTIAISHIISIFMVGLFIIFRKEVMSLFTDDKEVITIASYIMLIILPMYILNIPQYIFMQALRGFGKSFLPIKICLFIC